MATNATELAGSFWHWNARELGIDRWLIPSVPVTDALARMKAHLRDVHGLTEGDSVDLLHRDGTVSANIKLGRTGLGAWVNWFNDDYCWDIVAFKPAGVLFPGRPRVIVRG